MRGTRVGLQGARPNLQRASPWVRGTRPGCEARGPPLRLKAKLRGPDCEAIDLCYGALVPVAGRETQLRGMRPWLQSYEARDLGWVVQALRCGAQDLAAGCETWAGRLQRIKLGL